MRDGESIGAGTLLARAAAAEVRAHAALQGALDDFFLPDESRLGERVRSALRTLLRDMVEEIESELREHAARILRARGDRVAADALEAGRGRAYATLSEAGLLRDPELLTELFGRSRQEVLSDALPAAGTDETERPSLINRLVQHHDRLIVAAAQAFLVAENRRRRGGSMAAGGAELPAHLHHRLLWRVAGAVRTSGMAADIGTELAEPLDRAMCEAVRRNLAAYDEGDRLEAVAVRLAQAVDARGDELSDMLVESLGDRRLTLFIALLAHALTIGYDDVRATILDPAPERLWLMLRALDLPRAAVAQIGYALSEADPRRDLEAFAEALEAIMRVSPESARGGLAILRLDPEYRATLLALAARGVAQ